MLKIGSHTVRVELDDQTAFVRVDALGLTLVFRVVGPFGGKPAIVLVQAEASSILPFSNLEIILTDNSETKSIKLEDLLPFAFEGKDLKKS